MNERDGTGGWFSVDARQLNGIYFPVQRDTQSTIWTIVNGDLGFHSALTVVQPFDSDTMSSSYVKLTVLPAHMSNFAHPNERSRIQHDASPASRRTEAFHVVVHTPACSCSARHRECEEGLHRDRRGMRRFEANGGRKPPAGIFDGCAGLLQHKAIQTLCSHRTCGWNSQFTRACPCGEASRSHRFDNGGWATPSRSNLRFPKGAQIWDRATRKKLGRAAERTRKCLRAVAAAFCMKTSW